MAPGCYLAQRCQSFVLRCLAISLGLASGQQLFELRIARLRTRARRTMRRMALFLNDPALFCATDVRLGDHRGISRLACYGSGSAAKLSIMTGANFSKGGYFRLTLL